MNEEMMGFGSGEGGRINFMHWSKLWFKLNLVTLSDMLIGFLQLYVFIKKLLVDLQLIRVSE